MPHDPIAHPGREIRAEFGDVGDGVLKVGVHDLRGIFPIKGVATGEAVVVDAAEWIHIGAFVERSALELLGSHEVDGTKDGVAVVDGLERGGGWELGEAEVDELDLEAAAGEPGDHEVGGLDVAVDELEVLGGDEGFLALDGHFAEVLHGEDAALDHFVDGASGEEFHDDVGAVFVNPGIEDGDDVGVLYRAEGGGFLEHGLGGLLLVFVPPPGEDPLDRDFAIQMAVEGSVHCTDSSLANLTTDFIAIVGHGSSAGVSPNRAGNQVQLWTKWRRGWRSPLLIGEMGL
jgi:hypothetical protein